MDQKIFCLGFQKTGTNSVTAALKVLGYTRVAGYLPFRDLASDPAVTWATIEERAEELARDNEVFQDTPWPLLYEKFDTLYPDAKFILMIREPHSWVESCVGDFADHENYVHKLIYGVPYPLGHEDIWRERYEKHNADVQAYFEGRPDKLLVITTGEAAWEPLCAFLGQEVPDLPWPRANTRAQKKRLMFWARMRDRLRNVFGAAA
ncbi:MAG: sulfotransferase family protein [Pseudomonadota bacterium]